jgi:hypothetical protein
MKIDRNDVFTLEDLPNVGPATAGDLRAIGVKGPGQLCGKNPVAMYDKLCQIKGRRYDPCVLDVFISVVRFMDGEPARPWWKFTAERKRLLSGRTVKTVKVNHPLPPRFVE